MNTIITALLAFITGFISSTVLPSPGKTIESTSPSTATTEISATDFVSTRPVVDALPKESLSQDEVDGLLFMREEEKLARDVYQTLYDIWQMPIFANIAQSEQTHTEAVRDLLLKYDINDPVTDDTVGVFVNSDLQDLYDSLSKEGNTSLIAALRVGAIIEDMDINDLSGMISNTDNNDLKLVYENLARGSRNHLRAFVRQLQSQGSDYKPQYISEETYSTIIGGDQENGMTSEPGERGWGRTR